MRKRWFPLLVALFVFVSSINVYACDEEVTNAYVPQIIFGVNATKYQSNDKAKMLLYSLYCCSEQADGQGREIIDFLKRNHVSKVPELNDIDLKSSRLLENVHCRWEDVCGSNDKKQKKRGQLLVNTVNKVFDFGTINNLFRSGGEKGKSFSAMLYYSHILSDYLANNPDESVAVVKSTEVPAFSGDPSVEINGDKPSFTKAEIQSFDEGVTYSGLDAKGRTGMAVANLSYEMVKSSGDRQQIGDTKPSGWNQEKYPMKVDNPPYIYNRCHLIAHQLSGEDSAINLITGTRYLNANGMMKWENKVASYIRETNNHVLYRVKPIYKGNNLVASGVQMEAYSVEDHGKLHFNVYCYNIQPGISIDYETGKTKDNDAISGDENAIPFAVSNPSDHNPDLIYEMNKHIEIIFADQKKKPDDENYDLFMSGINEIASESRNIVAMGDIESPQMYEKLKVQEHKYYEILKTYVPKLLEEESFFKSTFK